MSPPKTYNVIIVPSDHSGTRQVQISRLLLIVAAIVAALVVITMTIFAATYTSVLTEARRAQSLEIENERLSEQVERVSEISRELEAISGLRAQVFNMLGASEDDGMAMSRLHPVGPEAVDAVLSDAERLRTLYAEDARKSFAPRAWPVGGRVRREFAAREDGDRPAHPGLSFEATAGETVRSAGAGRVTRLESPDGLFQNVEIDHGYGFRTLYSGLDRTQVEEGQAVARGQVLGHVGATSEHSRNQGSRIWQPALYFELRVDGTAVDPRSYLTPR